MVAMPSRYFPLKPVMRFGRRLDRAGRDAHELAGRVDDQPDACARALLTTTSRARRSYGIFSKPKRTRRLTPG